MREKEGDTLFCEVHHLGHALRATCQNGYLAIAHSVTAKRWTGFWMFWMRSTRFS